MLNKVYLAIGSNLKPQVHLNNALISLKLLDKKLRCSSIFKTKAVGIKGADFLNCVVELSTSYSIDALKKILKTIEKDNLRTKVDKTKVSLDLDLLLYNEIVDKSLNLPHQDIEKYPFILRGLVELNKNINLRNLNLTVRELEIQKWQNNLHFVMVKI